MELGEKLRQARLDAGLSQRQLCGDAITRNMLSQIEHGSARPSMDTLSYLASRLQKPMSYFLEEAASPNLQVIAQARQAYARGNGQELFELLSHYQGPDVTLDGEYGLLRWLCLLLRAETAVEENRPNHARQLLQEALEAEQAACYPIPELTQRRLLLLAQVSSQQIALPTDDRPLLVRADMALKAGDYPRGAVLLEACEDRSSPAWHRLRGEASFQMGQYAQSAEHYHQAETSYPKESYQRLEACYRAMEDYKMAYEYACKQR